MIEDSDRRRRIGVGVVVGLVLIGAIVLAVSLLRSGSGTDQNGKARVDAIFDAARGIGPRQVVKVAGARVGTVDDVTLTSDFKARVEMTIDKRFAPFRSDASCAIKPEGLISENFVACDPGSSDAPRLKGGASGIQTVPVEHTRAPVSLQDLFQIFNVPTTQRLQVLLDELGMSVAGRGSDLNSILYRANPTLASARKAIDVVDRQREQLVQLLDASEPVITALAKRNPDVKRFIDETAQLTTTTATHRAALGQAIKRLPPLLKAAEPALRELNEVAETAPPTLRQARAAAPALSTAETDIVPLSSSAVSALKALDAPLTTTRTALTRARPVISLLSTFAKDADPAARDLIRFLTSLRDSGAAENLLQLYYSAAGATNRFDSTSHLLFTNGSLNACALYARSTVGGCDASMDGISADTPSTRAKTRGTSAPRKHLPRRTTPQQTTTQAPATSTTPTPTPTPTPTSTTPTSTTPAPLVPTLPSGPSGSSADNPVKKVLDYLLK